MSIKFTTWNIENANDFFDGMPDDVADERRSRIRATVAEMDSDILCVQEGPEGEERAERFGEEALPDGWRLVTLPGPVGTRDDDYDTNGDQWIWYYVREELGDRFRIQPPAVWQDFTGGDDWAVHYWGEAEESDYRHWRHPQVMIMDQDGVDIEFIGVHLKSRHIRMSVERRDDGELTEEYVREALEARIKLATQATNVRDYVRAKFDQVAEPGLIVCGDCNDGPGKKFFEDKYLFFDLIQNLQGEVLMAERFFNHALFDYRDSLRWTARFDDPVTEVDAEDNPLLLDHILMSQPLVDGSLPLQVNGGAGKVEHQAYERNNAGATDATRTSDHRPVSCVFDEV